LSPEQYLEIERAAEFRHEYYNGQMYAMSGATHRHTLINGNIVAALVVGLRKRPCIVSPVDLRVRVSARHYTYPDITVVCGESKYVDNQLDTLINPVLLIEVLSPSTESYDRGLKARQYRSIESLQEYALVAQSEPRVEIFRRQASGDWLLSESAGLDAACRFDSVGCSIPLAEIYDKVTFEPDEPTPPQA
jgi:Uma2 family endonuclease